VTDIKPLTTEERASWLAFIGFLDVVHRPLFNGNSMLRALTTISHIESQRDEAIALLREMFAFAPPPKDKPGAALAGGEAEYIEISGRLDAFLTNHGASHEPSDE